MPFYWKTGDKKEYKVIHIFKRKLIEIRSNSSSYFCQAQDQMRNVKSKLDPEIGSVDPPTHQATFFVS